MTFEEQRMLNESRVKLNDTFYKTNMTATQHDEILTSMKEFGLKMRSMGESGAKEQIKALQQSIERLQEKAEELKRENNVYSYNNKSIGVQRDKLISENENLVKELELGLQHVNGLVKQNEKFVDEKKRLERELKAAKESRDAYRKRVHELEKANAVCGDEMDSSGAWIDIQNGLTRIEAAIFDRSKASLVHMMRNAIAKYGTIKYFEGAELHGKSAIARIEEAYNKGKKYGFDESDVIIQDLQKANQTLYNEGLKDGKGQLGNEIEKAFENGKKQGAKDWMELRRQFNETKEEAALMSEFRQKQDELDTMLGNLLFLKTHPNRDELRKAISDFSNTHFRLGMAGGKKESGLYAKGFHDGMAIAKMESSGTINSDDVKVHIWQPEGATPEEGEEILIEYYPRSESLQTEQDTATFHTEKFGKPYLWCDFTSGKYFPWGAVCFKYVKRWAKIGRYI